MGTVWNLGTQWGFWSLLPLLLALFLVGYPTWLLVRFVRASRRTKRHYLTAWYVRLRWRWLTRNLGLAKVDQDKTDRRKKAGHSGHRAQVLQYPKARVRPDDYGLVVKVKTAPGIGVAEWTAQADHLANAWKCVRVAASQDKPGRVTVRALRREPLADRMDMVDAPAGAFLEHSDPASVYCGRDEWARNRWLALSGIAGIAVGGLPGYGKTSLIGGWLYQLAPLPAVQFAIIDGMGGVDYEDWQHRAWIYTGDNLDRAIAAAEALMALMRYRVTEIRRRLGVKNGWHRGPCPEFPLIIIVWDECHTFFDINAAGSDRDLKTKYQRLISLAAQLAKKGRKAMMVNIFATQKQTADAIPTAIRDNCSVGISFATRTKEAAVAGLGEGIREHPEACPTKLIQRPTFVGVCTAALPDEHGFSTLRVPNVPDDDINRQAMATANCRQGIEELRDAQRWAASAPELPDAAWLIPMENLEGDAAQAAELQPA